jgi:hypothetical protein
VSYHDNYGNILKKGSRVMVLNGNDNNLATVTEAPRPSMMMPWHILVGIRYDKPYYMHKDISDPYYAVREINELKVVDP